jgi:hypothetical protein
MWTDDDENDTYDLAVDGCSNHAIVDCSSPECIRERGGSVLAAELAMAERLIGSV